MVSGTPPSLGPQNRDVGSLRVESIHDWQAVLGDISCELAQKLYQLW